MTDASEFYTMTGEQLFLYHRRVIMSSVRIPVEVNHRIGLIAKKWQINKTS